jgi:transposase
MEVGANSRWASHLLKELGHDVLVANARKLRAIYQNPRKGDRVDAETLARLARLDPDLLSPIHHRSPQAQADLAVLRSRDALVRSRTLLTPCQHRRCGINHARDIVKSTGARLPSCSADAFAQKAISSIPQQLQPALLPVFDIIASITQQIKSYDQQVENLCSQTYPETKLLRPVSGVGPLTSLGYILTLEDPDRFRKSRDVGPAVGLVPKRDQSGDRDPQLGTLAPALQVQVSPRPETLTCGDCSSPPPSTSWAPLGRIVTCAAGA